MLPSVSIVIPTLNSERVLDQCLHSISKQNYPNHLVEIIVADGGSRDSTLEIANKYRAKIFQNPLKTGEAGKAVGVKQAVSELVALIDSDNILPSEDWLLKMVKPFEDSEVVGSEPWEFTYRKGDGFIDRYCALLGMNDPICLFLGNYDKKSVLTGRWTDLPVQEEDQGDWIKLTLLPNKIPTIGANGTLFRRKIFNDSVLVNDYFFDIDILACLVDEGPVKFAKVKVGIVHLFCGSNVKQFIRKQRRRIKDYLYYMGLGVRKYPWKTTHSTKLVKFVFFCLTVLPLWVQALKGFFKKPDLAWFFHPLACWLTLWEYGWRTVSSSCGKSGKLERTFWKQ
ncbi:MAG: glycosyltransferase family 2 protein [Chlamydiae bacterium]|nr:glycosyltransferase family 2 protein [Chlamydiota bacterium]MBI3266514.1 glycosyltransferase family 2 protein [Chlamydiota bacterium]